MAAQPNQYIDPTGRFAESTMRIQDLAQAEKVQYQKELQYNTLCLTPKGTETRIISRNCCRSPSYTIR